MLLTFSSFAYYNFKGVEPKELKDLIELYEKYNAKYDEMRMIARLKQSYELLQESQYKDAIKNKVWD